MNEENLIKLYTDSVRAYIKNLKQGDDPYEECRTMVLSVIAEMKEQGFDTATLEELAQRIV
jgi:hypothetical protein